MEENSIIKDFAFNFAGGLISCPEPNGKLDLASLNNRVLQIAHSLTSGGCAPEDIRYKQL